ncbi:conserved protein of unknown function [Modestobacter italicus]|uniref:Uncharacterized protein n=1 Tax=Modestobacter italicus (strain DSM 44449 / CECT 9708 / BC 501) TaxID=2732864 RepID=I4F1P3_MODI5|nr:hypothetical protein [Modestobacter marinus]CCH89556.1 conserved protein of unknown function [Modestobacter marinus]
MTTLPHPSIPVTSDAELTERWRTLLHLDGSPSQRRLFLAWLRTDGTMVPLLIPVEELPVEPDRVAIGNVHELHSVVAESEGLHPADLHLAMCLERPGPATADDDAWCAAIESIVRGRDGIDCSLHVGDGRIAHLLLPRRRWPAG